MNDLLKPGTKSPQTTLGGVLAFLLVLIQAAHAQWDGDPATIPQWAPVLPAALLAYALFKARDHGVTSEQAGAKE